MFAECASVRVTRSEADYPSTALQSSVLGKSLDSHVAYIALGSNMGNRAENIEKSIRMMQESGVTLLDSSFMYESDAMYVTDQAKFLNCVLKIATLQSPEKLLETLKHVESELGRAALGVRQTNGPRPIDLDILFFDRIVIQSQSLIIPHPRLQERLFVLKPLVEYVAPN